MQEYTLDRSIAASMLRQITTWRNPQGAQKNWIANESAYFVRPWIWTRVKAEAGFGFAYVVARIELLFAKTFRCPSWRRSSEFAARMAKCYLEENFYAANLPTEPEELFRRLSGEQTINFYVPITSGRTNPTR